jgi:threonine dehydratase
MAVPDRTRSVEARDVARARAAVADVVRQTPVLPSLTLSERTGGTVVLKAESLQRTGSFKVRGALSKLAALGEDCVHGVTAGSAGNHAWALAHAARARGVPCEVFMPAQAPLAKAEGCTELGAVVHLGGESVEECVAAARARAEEAGMAFVHPFDDPDVVAGQGTLGLELLEDVPDLAKVVVPVGGGGLAAGVAIAVKSARPEVEVVGVDDVVVVPEDDVAEAMVLCLEKARLVVEGAGAVGVAALLGGQTAAARAGTTCVVLSGGNVDAGLLASVARRHESEAGRRLVLFTRVPDRPGSLARLLAVVGQSGANLVDVEHLREGLDLHVRETAVQLVLETRGPQHAGEVLERVRAAGYEPRIVR